MYSCGQEEERNKYSRVFGTVRGFGSVLFIFLFVAIGLWISALAVTRNLNPSGRMFVEPWPCSASFVLCTFLFVLFSVVEKFACSSAGTPQVPLILASVFFLLSALVIDQLCLASTPEAGGLGIFAEYHLLGKLTAFFIYGQVFFDLGTVIWFIVLRENNIYQAPVRACPYDPDDYWI